MEFSGAARLMIVSDLDNTMVDHKDNHYTSLLRFGSLWQADYNQDSLLVYSTGRSPTLYEKLQSEVPLLTPGITILSVGTEIRYGESMAPDLGWEEVLNQGWNREVIVEEGTKLNLKFQVDSEQRPHKVSFYVDKYTAEDVIKVLAERIEKREVNAKLLYSGGIDLDVIPTGAGKGPALAYLMRKLKDEGRSPGKTLVCGDSGNDADLFTVPGVYGVIVGNAMEELLKWYREYTEELPQIYLAKERCAAGILEAMQHFDMQPNVSPRDRPRAFQTLGGVARLSLSSVSHEVVDYLLLLEHWYKADVDNTDFVFSRLKESLAPDAWYVHAYGITTNPSEDIETLRDLHGVKKGKHYCIWVDRVRIEKLSDSLYLARFDMWEKSGPRFSCAVTTALLQSKIDAVNGLQWKFIHETWLIGREGTKLIAQPQLSVSAAAVSESPSPETLTPEPRTPRAPMPESLKFGVPESLKFGVPESLKFVVPESLQLVVPESLQVVVPESSQVVVPESLEVVVPETSNIVLPESLSIAVPESLMPKSLKIIVPE